MDINYKHYIRLDGVFICKSFSTAFEQPIDGDICINENGGRHYNRDLYRADGLYRLKWIDGKEVETTDDDFVDELAEIEKQSLRQLREVECFDIINRGRLWYDVLTDEQENELNTWYADWLDVTNTLTVPTKPVWLEDM